MGKFLDFVLRMIRYNNGVVHFSRRFPNKSLRVSKSKFEQDMGVTSCSSRSIHFASKYSGMGAGMFAGEGLQDNNQPELFF